MEKSRNRCTEGRNIHPEREREEQKAFFSGPVERQIITITVGSQIN